MIRNSVNYNLNAKFKEVNFKFGTGSDEKFLVVWPKIPYSPVKRTYIQMTKSTLISLIALKPNIHL